MTLTNDHSVAAYCPTAQVFTRLITVWGWGALAWTTNSVYRLSEMGSGGKGVFAEPGDQVAGSEQVLGLGGVDVCLVGVPVGTVVLDGQLHSFG
jgi:hypothetical protein